MAVNVRFVKTTKEKYLNKSAYDKAALYFCTDTQELFVGDALYSGGFRVVSSYDALPAKSIAPEGITYICIDTGNGYLISPDRTIWLQVIYATVADINEISELDADNYIPTVGAIHKLENTLREYVEQEINAVEVGGVEAINFAGAELVQTGNTFSIDQTAARDALGITLSEQVTREAIESLQKNITNIQETYIDRNFLQETTQSLKDYMDEQMEAVEVSAFDDGEV